MSQFYLIVAITVLSPYLKLLIPLCSKIGLFSLVIWTISGYLNSFLQVKQVKQRYGIIGQVKKSNETLQDYIEFFDSSLPLERLQISIIHVLDQVIQKVFTGLLLDDLSESPTAHLKSINRLSIEISEKFIDVKEDHIEQRLWVNVWSEVLGFLRVFKRLRKETLKENLSSSQRKNLDQETLSPDLSHLDEYNSLDDMEWESQENSWPSQDRDELLLQISAKFIKLGYIHPAIGSAEREQAYIRLLMDQVFYKLGLKDKTGNKLERLLIREGLAYFLWTLIDKWSQPEILNSFILEKVSY